MPIEEQNGLSVPQHLNVDLSMIKVILFDIGGVFVPIGGQQRMVEWTRGAYTLDELWDMWLSADAVRQFETGHLAPNEFAEAIVKLYQLSVSPEEFLQEFQGWTSSLYPGAQQMLQSLKGDRTLACLSNTNPVQWNNLQKTTRIDAYFEHVFVSYEIQMMKPDPRIYEHVLLQLDVRPEEVIFFDDTLVNIESARNLGVNAVQVRGEDGLFQPLQELGLFD